MSNVKGPDTAPNLAERFECLVNRYQESILHMCYLYLCDKTLAEDAVQETFLKVYRTMDTFRGECSEKTWIVRIAMHTCYDINHAGWFRFMNRNVTPEMLPERASTSQDRDEELANAVMRLPRKLREVILLHYYQGLKVNEIADALNISHSSVSGRMKRGREKLKKCWKGESLMNEKISADEFHAALDRHLSDLKADPYLAQRIIANEEGEKPGMKKISVSLAAACIFIIIMMSAALAVGNLVPGIREMLGLDRSADTENMVQTVSYNWETDYNTATVREMLYDGQGVYIAVDVQKKPRDDILLIPSGNQKLSLRSSASNLGKQDVENGETIAEYAGRKGMTVVYFSIKAENAGKTFSASVNPGDIIAVEEEHWTLVLRFPAVDQNEQIRLCLYTTAHDRESPIAEPHSITVNVPDFQDISDEKIVTDSVSVVENSALKGFSIQEAKLIRTPIATYLDVWIGNTNQTEYSTIHAAITPLGIAKPEHYHFESPQRFADGYSAGARAIELFPEEDFRCSAFQVDLSVLPMQTAGETAGTYQLKNTGSVTITFEDSDN